MQQRNNKFLNQPNSLTEKINYVVKITKGLSVLFTFRPLIVFFMEKLKVFQI